MTQPLMQSVIPTLDPGRDDSQRSVSPSCSKEVLTFLGKFPRDKLPEETIGGGWTGIRALTAAGWVCPNGVYWAAAATLPQWADLKAVLTAPANTARDGASYSFTVSEI